MDNIFGLEMLQRYLGFLSQIKKSVWRNFYTKEVVQYDGPFTGGRPNGGIKENCALQLSSGLWIDWFCEEKNDLTFCFVATKKSNTCT